MNNQELLEDFNQAHPKSFEVIKNLIETDTEFTENLKSLKEKDPKAYQMCVIGNVTTNLANDDYIRVIKEGRYPTWMCWM